MAKKNYSINEKKKIITVNMEKLDIVEKEIVQMYINGGYKVYRGKSNPWNKTTIYKWLKKYVSEEEANKFKVMIATSKDDNYDETLSKGWVNGRKWFFDTYTAKKRADLEKADKE